MLTHTWIEQYRNTPAGDALATAVRSAVQFDFGDADALPIGRGSDITNARPPFNDCVLQFSTPDAKLHSHALILWQQQPDGSTHLTCALKIRGYDGWRTTTPHRITRCEDYHEYEGFGSDEALGTVKRLHAKALNAFYILGCANVQTVDHTAPDALNKKRARSGKFPILTHKTLVVITDDSKVTRVDQGGTHTSPRVHLRRGHVRRLVDGRRVWVQPCVVGSHHGVVTKDYQVRARATLEATPKVERRRRRPLERCVRPVATPTKPPC